MANKWIEHVKAYAAKNKIPYGKAISAARASSKSKGKDVKSKNKNRDFEGKISSKISSRKPDVKRAAKRASKKDGEAELGGKKIKFSKGGLHKSLKTPDDYKFKKSELRKLNKVEIGDMFDFQKKKMKMTSRIKKQITLGLNLMK